MTDSNKKKPTQQPAKPKKRKSGVPAIWQFEEPVFDLVALQTVFAGKPVTPALKKKMDDLAAKVSEGEQKRKYRRQRPVNTISCGKETVAFFIKNPALIPVMATEQYKRSALAKTGEDLTFIELDHSDLYNHCKNMATWIYSQDESNGEDYNWDKRYRHIRTNYVYTMGRASRSAGMALQELARYQQEIARSQQQTASQPTKQEPSQNSEVSFEEMEMCAAELQAEARKKAAAQKRAATLKDKKAWAAEQELAELLHNKCNDDFGGEEKEETTLLEPQKRQVPSADVSQTKTEPQPAQQPTLTEPHYLTEEDIKPKKVSSKKKYTQLYLFDPRQYT